MPDPTNNHYLALDQGHYHPSDFVGKHINIVLAELHEEEARRLREIDYLGVYWRAPWRVETNMPLDHAPRHGTAQLHIGADGILGELRDSYDSSD